MVEVSLVVASAAVPYQVGVWITENHSGDSVPLNPALQGVNHVVAWGFGHPDRREPTVAPATNLLWSAALVFPIAVGGMQLYGLWRTGQTWSKKWLRVQVVTATGAVPSWSHLFLREGVGRWGLPWGLAYGIWRISGAFPDVTVFLGLGAIAMVAEASVAAWHPRRRTLHDRLAETYVLDALAQADTSDSWQVRTFSPTVPTAVEPQAWNGAQWQNTADMDEDAAIAAIVLRESSPEPTQPSQPGLWPWMVRHPGITLLGTTAVAMVSVLATFVGTQVYIQQQTNQRASQQQENEMFLALLDKLVPKTPEAAAERRSAILALGAVEDARAIPLLVDLLGQETEPELVDTIQQALVSRGPEALPHLHRLNRTLENDLASLRYAGETEERRLVAQRQRATKRAIAKILTVYTGNYARVDLSQVNLGKTQSPHPFTLVVQQNNLAGINLRSAILRGAQLQNSRFASAGEDERLGTFDDRIADLSGANLMQADLTGAFLSYSSMENANWIDATLKQAQLNQAALAGSNFSNANLMQASFQQANLTDAKLTGGNLVSADFTRANLQGVNAGRVQAQGANFVRSNLARSSWQGADFAEADFQGSNLAHTDLSGARLRDANLANAQLQNANLTDADLSHANLQGAKLDGANFAGVTFMPPQPPTEDEFIRRVESPTGKLAGVDFTGVKNLNANQMAYICAQKGLHPRCSSNQLQPDPLRRTGQSRPE
jgi:uncharacterized protein YjbI with pentapeptide repeats/uncharacterized RDD family membrane protein YckC